jgi:glycosidase
MARDLGLEIALDIAFQCSPDHPYVREHPEWFRKRPDGSIQFAENPPKKYQDIYPFDFECAEWQALRDELVSVVRYWIDHGVRVFSVDNPHTKPFALWEHLISEIKSAHPETIFLSEAFTRPRVMQRLAKVGFSQSYTYFTWRNTKAELESYFTELTRPPLCDYFRPNACPTRPISCRSSSSMADGRHRRRASCWRRRCVRPMASTGRHSSCATCARANRAARSTSIPKSTSCGNGSSIAPTAWRRWCGG